MAAEEPTRAVAFLAAFNEIEAFLRDALGAKKTDSFKWMCTQGAKRGVLTRDQADDLKEFAELRNAISHGEYRDFRPIAEPLQETVDEIRRIRDSLVEPTLAVHVVGQGQQVVTFAPDDDILEPLHAIRETGHTQFPIYEGGTCVGLLTTNAIARWVSAELERGNPIDAEGEVTTVAEALKLSGQHDTAAFLPRTATAAMAIDALTTPLDSGALPRIVIITEHGQPTQRPIAIVGATDIPALADEV
ncbi:CBS domain-containing protein [Corynebacterium sp. CNCTC7651]|uniref:CBS domain-containing protein n=1 Tax=Corynebacterium sp. CNCTC7651 TaxID=2815361 RepID=UPI001F2DB03F|nr:CBS domain-containing protein [Corynebacterium sp. CNCTC7651]